MDTKSIFIGTAWVIAVAERVKVQRHRLLGHVVGGSQCSMQIYNVELFWLNAIIYEMAVRSNIIVFYICPPADHAVWTLCGAHRRRAAGWDAMG